LVFDLPAALEAGEPPEARGLSRADVRMLVSYRRGRLLFPSTFTALPDFLEAGDVLVLNTSGTIPAAIDAMTNRGEVLVIHLSTQLDATHWVVEPRRVHGPTSERWHGTAPGGRLRLAEGASRTLEEPYGPPGRLWVASLTTPGAPLGWLASNGRPIRYRYAREPWPLEMYQNVYANEPGSAEMASAGRPFTSELVTALVAQGVDVAPLVLHTGVSSLEADELPYPERVRVPASTAARVNLARAGGHRVIAVGTTVVRALETAATADGRAQAYDGWTELVITPERGVLLTDGLLTGWHEPASSHLLMLEALAGTELLRDSYAAGLANGYRWHEFGDVHLVLP
jgi:S-adenosylmethionine:tRNA ribosyltransferase-isomerase